MSLLVLSPSVRRVAAATALAAIAALALGFCLCEMPVERATRAAGECHEAVEASAPPPSPDGAWSSDCCCSDDPRLLPGTLETREQEAQRAARLLAAASAFAGGSPALDPDRSTPAPPWLVAASPPHAPPSAFALPLRV